MVEKARVILFDSAYPSSVEEVDAMCLNQVCNRYVTTARGAVNSGLRHHNCRVVPMLERPGVLTWKPESRDGILGARRNGLILLGFNFHRLHHGQL